MPHTAVFVIVLLSTIFIETSEAIQCYQCDSDFDPINCRADKPFDRNINALVDCLTDEAYAPGTFCMKTEYRSPGWWGWHKVTRRCGVAPSIGSEMACARGLQDQGVYIITCNCNTDGCNSSSYATLSLPFLLASLLMTLYAILH